MIPEEVVTIAEILAEEYKGCEGDYEQFIDIAYKIYNKMKLCACD